MAASMIRCRICNSIRNCYQLSIRNVSYDGYYVLLPEIPPDTPETNAAMRYKNYPEIKSFTADDTIKGCLKYVVEYDLAISKLKEKLEDPNQKKDFSTVFEPLEKITVPLNYVLQTTDNLSCVNATGGYRDAFAKMFPQYMKCQGKKWQHPSIHNAIKELNADSANLTDHQRRVVNLQLIEGRMCGAEISPGDRKRFYEIVTSLESEKRVFRNKVLICQNMFSLAIHDESKVKNMPQQLKNIMAQDKTKPSRGPWQVTLQPSMYFPFMEHCDDRSIRHNVWDAFNNRASIKHSEQHLSNAKTISDIRAWRAELARYLGYETFADMTMENTMAGSVENVINMIESLRSKFDPLAAEEITKLQEFATSEGFNEKLQMWDIHYYKRKQRQQILDTDDGLRPYFPFQVVFQGLLKLCSDMFGIKFKDCTGEVDTWHSDVTFYKIYNGNGDKEIAAFYVDPYARPREKIAGSSMKVGRERSELMGTTPISYLNLNLQLPFGHVPSLMTFADVQTLFDNFGTGLHQLLSAAPYLEISGMRGMEWDTLLISSSFMTKLLRVPQVLKKISKNVSTGEPLSDDLIAKVLKVQNHMGAYEKMYSLYLSAFDMEMYVSKTHWFEVQKKLWAQYMPLIPFTDEDNQPCCFKEIFSDEFPAAFYSFMWSDMVSANIFEAFQEIGFENEDKIQALGKRLHDTFLSVGGSVPPNEIFRKFRGWDPSIDSLVNLYTNDK